MTTTLCLDLSASFDKLLSRGYVFVPNALTNDSVRDLIDVVGMKEFVRARESINGVPQDFVEWVSSLRAASALAITDFAAELRQATSTYPSSSLRRWRPNQVSIQCYSGSPVGIGAHKDFVHDQLLVAVVNLYGTATFNILEDDRTSPVDHWLCEAGDLILLAGSGLGTPNDRPVHSVTSLRSARASLALRMTA